jgi:hypothetical protein
MPGTPDEPLNKLLRSAACTNPVLEILMYSARTLRFLRSGLVQTAFARDASSEVRDRESVY